MADDFSSNRPHPPYAAVDPNQRVSHGRFDDAPPPRSKLPWILGCLGASIVLGVLLCCGAIWGMMSFGMNTVAQDIRIQLRDHPTIKEHIGEIESIEVDFSASLAHPDDETFVYTVDGSKGDGELTVKSITHFDDSEEIISAQLRTDAGETYDLEL
ncbi:Coa1/Tim21 domain-containing protein [Roseimaritima sediminicola]|uniref:hypothetical protein n=1 Tax=Roseimaritima sediminicola TaxID=2662066 RepID=UPI0012984F6F|nr:hypothetical protein [Roseimaritima sediminicola]